MVKINKDSEGKTRVAKGDKTGLGGQFAPDPVKMDAAKTNIKKLEEELTPNYKGTVDVKSLRRMGAISLAEIIVEAERVGAPQHVGVP